MMTIDKDFALNVINMGKGVACIPTTRKKNLWMHAQRYYKIMQPHVCYVSKRKEKLLILWSIGIIVINRNKGGHLHLQIF